MRLRPASNPCALPVITTALISLSLTGCDKLTPNGQSDTMTLLRGGSEKVCVSPDVQKSVRNLIIPSVVDDVPGDGSPEDKVTAINTVSLSFDLTTLQGFDKAVSRATCNAVVKITGQGNKANTFNIDFDVSPSAETPTTFVVTSRTGDAKAYARDLIAAAVDAAATARQAQQQDAQEKQAKALLLATITPKWLVGTWIETTVNVLSCVNGHAMLFRPNRSFTANQTVGQWSLTGDNLHIVGQDPNGPVDLPGTITAADALSFTLLSKDGTSTTLRRCSRDELSTVPSMNSTEGMDLAPNR